MPNSQNGADIRKAIKAAADKANSPIPVEQPAVEDKPKATTWASARPKEN